MSKKRISLTVEEELVGELDREASRRGINRSRMVEEVVKDYIRRKSIDTAVVLCGGDKGISMENHDGRPVLEHVLERLSRQGISRCILLVGKNEMIEEHFGSSFEEMALDYVSEEDPSGTAAALSKAEDMVEESFAVLNGHVISDVDLHEMVEEHRKQDSMATMALTTVEDPSSYGVARLKGSRILGFEEKPEPGEEPSRLINAGTYIVEPEIFDRLDEDDLEAVFERLADRGRLSGYIYGGEWRDVDEN